MPRFQTVRRTIRAALLKVDVKPVPYSLSVEHRRVLLAQHSGAQVLLDIGANTGQWASEVRGAGWTGDIYSYEPVSAAYAQLAAKAAKDSRWHTSKVALGDEPGTADINISDDTVYSSLAPMMAAGMAANPRAAVTNTEQVEVQTLDDVTASMREPLGVKMDVQGFESKVMDGGKRTLNAAPFLEVELSLVPCYEGEPLYREMLERILGYGFRLALVEPVWMNPATGEALQFNGLFIRD